MPRVAKTLSDVHVRKLSFAVTAAGKPKAALHPVGGVAGLRLQVSPLSASNPKGAKSWIYKITIGSKRKEIGLGSYPEVSLKDARELARLKYESIKSGLDPMTIKTEVIKDSFRAFDKNAERHRPIVDSQFVPEIKSIFPSAKSTRWQKSGQQQRGVNLPSLLDAREEFEACIGFKVEWEANVDLVE